MDSMLLACQLQSLLQEKRPTLREKLFNNNVSTLSDEELVSLLLRTGTSECNLKKLSKKVLQTIDKSDNLEKDLRKREIIINNGKLSKYRNNRWNTPFTWKCQNQLNF